MTFPGGTHDLWIRYWLAAGGIDPDKDIETIIVPPPQMVANMKVGTMDCFCVCEPWNDAAHQPEHRLHRASTPASSGTSIRKNRFAHARRLGRQASERRQGAADGGAWKRRCGATRWRTARSSPRSCAKRQWINCPVADIIDRTEGQVRLRHRPRGREQPAHHEVLARLRLLSVPEPRAVVPHRGHPLGQVRAGDRRARR